ncbi:MAG: hypothetical protein KC731_07055 [Myxococcales bacterium]|nr:hypothetical protein [Myxococcales bacterium]
MTRRLVVLALPLALPMALPLVGGCGASEPQAPPPVAVAPIAQSSGTPLEGLFPLVDQNQYHYATQTDDGEGVLLARVVRDRPDGGTLRMPGGDKHFRYVGDGVTLDRQGMMPAYVLKTPLAVGNRWRGEHGGWVEITAVDQPVQVPAGSYTGCVVTVEERRGDLPLRVATTFCPDVGIVVLEAASGQQSERATLQSYGPPIDLGPDGVRRIP